jgi:hypothetical protein
VGVADDGDEDTTDVDGVSAARGLDERYGVGWYLTVSCPPVGVTVGCHFGVYALWL